MHHNLAVGLGEIKISRDPEEILLAFGLGSCLGIGMYDPAVRVAGLLHAVLPKHTNGAADRNPKYVESGILALLDEMTLAGALRHRLIVRMAGGANLLVAPGFSKALNIGSRNVESAYATLASVNLKLASQEVGGSLGRTVRFYVADGRMTIRTAGNREREI